AGYPSPSLRYSSNRLRNHSPRRHSGAGSQSAGCAWTNARSCFTMRITCSSMVRRCRGRSMALLRCGVSPITGYWPRVMQPRCRPQSPHRFTTGTAMDSSPPTPPESTTPTPRHERLDTIVAQVAALDELVRLARRSIRVFDVDLSEMGWNSVARADALLA